MREYEVLDGEVRFTHRGERHFSAAPGLAGGGQRGDGALGDQAGRPHRRGDPLQDHDDARKRRPPVVETAGGGGYGDPRRRPVDRVEADIRNGKVSLDAARTIYGQIHLAPGDAERERDLAPATSGPSLASGPNGQAKQENAI